MKKTKKMQKVPTIVQLVVLVLAAVTFGLCCLPALKVTNTDTVYNMYQCVSAQGSDAKTGGLIAAFILLGVAVLGAAFSLVMSYSIVKFKTKAKLVDIIVSLVVVALLVTVAILFFNTKQMYLNTFFPNSTAQALARAVYEQQAGVVICGIVAIVAAVGEVGYLAVKFLTVK